MSIERPPIEAVDDAEFQRQWEARAASFVAWPYSRSEYLRRIIWAVVYRFIWPLCWSRLPMLRTALLRAMGAKMKTATGIAGSVRITLPWDLSIGHHVVIGDHATLYNLGGLSIGNYSVLSQDVYLAGGTHDPSNPANLLIRQKITIGNYVWIAAGAFIGPGVHIGDGAVVGARAVVMRDVDPWTIVAGNPAKLIKRRVIPGLKE